MSIKRDHQEWETKLKQLIEYTDKEIVNSLGQIQALGLNIDGKFGEFLVRTLKNRYMNQH